VHTAIRMPRALRDEIKRQAHTLGRSINTHAVMILSEATEMATGDKPASNTPAAENDEAALQGGSL